VRDLGPARADDDIVRRAVLDGDGVLVSKDSQFHRRSFLAGAPPEVVWVRLGNCATEDVHGLLRRSLADLRRFVADPDAPFLGPG
jgi:predicted nuclease of predicted toxin-antitoxin system